MDLARELNSCNVTVIQIVTDARRTVPKGLKERLGGMLIGGRIEVI